MEKLLFYYKRKNGRVQTQLKIQKVRIRKKTISVKTEVKAIIRDKTHLKTKPNTNIKTHREIKNNCQGEVPFENI